VVSSSRELHVRVVAGTFGGRRLAAPAGRDVRPTSDRVREALFGWLGALDGASVLDVYAGSGAVGIEALSRGAERVVFAERAAGPLSVLEANLRSLGIGDAAHVRRGDAAATIRRLGREGQRFELVFLDPPYASGEAARALRALVEAEILAPAATVVVEAAWRHPVPAVIGLQLVETRRYGDTVLLRFAAGARGATDVDAGTLEGPPVGPDGGPTDA
jgi:16S rRNA (guanine(966)-N(2))-methyltransferase RsmD